MLDLISTSGAIKEYCGLPVPIRGERLVLEPRHPAAAVYAEVDAEYNGEMSFSCSAKDVNETTSLVNVFYSHRERCDIVIYRVGEKTEWGKIPALNHIKNDLSTMGCSAAWSVDAEIKAMEMLNKLLPPHIFKMYFLSGMFLETSRRSGVTYIFRRLKPTIAIRPAKNGIDSRILCCLCLHPIGYYEDTWAGAMCPTDDVIAHLLLMRADEKLFWRRANQIAPHRPEAGL
jgi:hypothetical protein